ncbi:hypothetical protein [Photobacterium leiognathi]|uniref:hypothetical protein n=1 Tax=Photobacterium leiognathi TaxID=553611 RepID=UPI002738A216|nr:hypothetical protein [Photobacterium leiognathi]
MQNMYFSFERHDGLAHLYATQWRITTLDHRSEMRLVIKSVEPLTLMSPMNPSDLTQIRQQHDVTFCTEYRTIR